MPLLVGASLVKLSPTPSPPAVAQTTGFTASLPL